MKFAARRRTSASKARSSRDGPGGGGKKYKTQSSRELWDPLLASESKGWADDGALARLTTLPLRAAFTGLGTAWLTRTICFKRLPGSIYGQVPLEALHEVFKRHVKAADKRLRCDQVHYLEVRTSAPAVLMERLAADHPGLTPAVLAHSMSRSTGALLSAYQLTAADITPEVLASFSDRILQVASRMNVVHDWEQTVRLVEHLLNAFEPLFSGVTRAELKVAGQQARTTFGRLPMPEWGEQLFKAIRARPDRLLHRIGTGTGRLEDAKLDQWDWAFGAHIKLYSTRGGWWPERRACPDSVRATPEEIRGWLIDRFAGDDEEARPGGLAPGARGGSRRRLARASRPRRRSGWRRTARLWRGGWAAPGNLRSYKFLHQNL